ncbi:CHAT domain protein [Ceratobasidium sp. AG-Ba]|nr:CHAT domain protein [Ceratobasidium sp. AG-Ba]
MEDFARRQNVTTGTSTNTPLGSKEAPNDTDVEQGQSTEWKKELFEVPEVIDPENMLNELAMAAHDCEKLFKAEGDVELLELSITLARQAMALNKRLQYPLFDLFKTLGSLLDLRFEVRGAIGDIDEAIEISKQALEVIPKDNSLLEGHPDQLGYLNDLGNAWYRRFERLGELVDIDQAIGYQSRAVKLTPDGDTQRPGRLINLGNSWQRRFERLGETGDINQAIECMSQALELFAEGDSQKPICFSNLGNSFLLRFKRFGETVDIGQAIEYHVQAVNLTSYAHIDKPTYLTSAGAAWKCRFEKVGDIMDIEQAIEYQSQAVKLTTDENPEKPNRLTNLGNSLQCRFERLGEMMDIEQAIECQSQAVKLSPDGHPYRPMYLNNLGSSWQRRFERLGELADIDKAIECQSHAVHITPTGHPEKAGYLNNLGNTWQCRFERLGELLDIEKAIGYQSQAVNLIAEGHPRQHGYLGSLGSSLLYRFERLGEIEDIDKAIDCHFQASRLAPESHPQKPMHLCNLGMSRQRRFERLGQLVDIDQAIECQFQAVQLTPDGHPDKPGRLSRLGTAWHCRYERLGELLDIDQAIERQSQAVMHTPEDHPHKPTRLTNLGYSQQRRFERLGELVDIDKAIECQSQSVKLTPDGHPDKPGRLNNLGNSRQRRFEALGEVLDIEHAIECHSQAAMLTPDGHPNKPSSLNSLGTALKFRFERFHELAEIDRAIEHQSHAVKLTPDGHPDKPAYLHNLGQSWKSRFDHLQLRDDLEKACAAFRTGAESAAFRPSHQMTCAQNWALTSVLLDISPLQAYKTIFSMLPRLVWVGQTIHNRQKILTMFSTQAAQAAAWAISVGFYDLALEWLEQGRSVVWNQTLQLRDPFKDLSHVAPQLAHELRAIASKLDAAGSSPSLQLPDIVSNDELASQTTRHHELARQWDELVLKARLLPGFEEFMLPLKANRLKQAAQSGPVVLINIDDESCDALLVIPQIQDIKHVSLTKASREGIDSLSSHSFSSIGKREVAPNARGVVWIESLDNLGSLTALWSGIVEPILEALSQMDISNTDELPHVTWCATGALSFAPFHAAGLYDGVSPNTSDLVVSSYTPTLSALLLHNATSGSHSGLLIVGQETSPGQTTLPNTVNEVKIVSQYNSTTRCCQLEGSSATVSATLAAMEQHSWAHLACHASQNHANPSQSAFHLHDGDLTLEEIAKRQFKNKGLAFLSACQTATGDRALPDEANHLAAGMLISGYPSVIATMWSIWDEDAPLVAQVVYSELMKDGKMDHTRAARALHKAVGELRRRVGEKEVERWAPFIHMGV